MEAHEEINFASNNPRDSEEIEPLPIDYGSNGSMHEKCQLPPEADIFLDFFPGHSRRERFVRKMNRWRTIQENSIITKESFRSSQIIKNEVLDHVILQNYTIHPYSRLR